MATPILATKLYVPSSRSQLVHRPRLLNQLNEGVQGKLTLISAPAGFGKTTLVSDWIADSQQATAWLSLDDGDNDPVRFWTYFIAALQSLALSHVDGLVPALGAGALTMLQAPQPPATESVLTVLLNEITAVSHNIILVLDDYHLLDAPAIDEALSLLLEHLPPQMHLVIASREDPSLPLARLRVRGQLTELRAADLRFTAEEAAEFLNQAMNLTLSAEDVSALETRTEGWIAGLQLAALALQGASTGQGEQDTTRFIQSFTGRHHFVLDYLIEEVLYQQSETVQTFLLHTAILDRFCGSLCDAVLNASAGSGQETLTYLQQANLFIIPLDNERCWYRYHHLFGDLLRQRLQQNPPPINSSTQPVENGIVAELHRRASVWYEENDFEFEAIHHALVAEDFERAAALIEWIFPVMDGSFQTVTWFGWAEQLPEAIVRVRPNLILGYAWTYLNNGELEAGELHLQEAERWGDKTGDDEAGNDLSAQMIVVDEAQFRRFPASIASARSYIAQIHGDVPATIKYIEQALALFPEEEHVARTLMVGFLGAAYWTNGELEAAYKTTVNVAAELQKSNSIPFAIAMTYSLASIGIALGWLDKTIHIYEQSLQLALAQGSSTVVGTADLYLWLSQLHHERGAGEVAHEYLQKSVELGEQFSLPDWPYRVHIVQAQMKATEGALEDALLLLDAAEPLFYPVPVPDVHPIGALRARVWIKQGELIQAQEWARDRGLSIEDELSYLHEFEYVTLARLWIADYKNGRSDTIIQDAVNLLERLLATAEKGNRTGSMIEILLLQAVAHEAQENNSDALVLLERALYLAEPDGYGRIFLEEGQPIVNLLTKIKDKDSKMNEFVNKLLITLSKQDDLHPSSPILQPLVEPLSQRELEVLQLIAEGASNREISERLFLALSTVKGHNMKIFGKLQVQRRTEAVARARELGLL